MAFRYFPVTAALALALVCHGPAESAPDRYQTRVDGATDAMLQVAAMPRRLDQKETDARTKRGFAQWSGQQALLPGTGYDRFSMWKPSPYQLSRPYFIPIYGAAGRVPIYFPPQRLNLNPGVPVDNPLPYRGPVYLPPKETSTMKINNRFDDDDDDDRPIWGTSAPATDRPNMIIPTRPPRPASTPAFPPLVHDVNNGNFLNAEGEKESSMQSVSRPVASGPTNCAWAIVSCCSAASSNAPASCFEQRGCPGPFWGPSPCESDYARAAIQSALKYFGQ